MTSWKPRQEAVPENLCLSKTLGSSSPALSWSRRVKDRVKGEVREQKCTFLLGFWNNMFSSGKEAAAAEKGKT